VPVTQLYVSVDASTKDGLKKIDRPLFRDFWDRFISSLRALSDKVGDLRSFVELRFLLHLYLIQGFSGFFFISPFIKQQNIVVVSLLL